MSRSILTSKAGPGPRCRASFTSFPPAFLLVVEEDAPAVARPRHSVPGKVFGEVMTFEEMDEVMKIIDRQEGYRADAIPNRAAWCGKSAKSP